MGFQRLKDVDIAGSIGQTLYVSFLVVGVAVKPQTNGGKFMALTMVDGEKRHGAKIFSIDSKIEDGVKDGNVYNAEVQVKKYKEGHSCIITHIMESDIERSEFIGRVPNLDRYIADIDDIMTSLEGTAYFDIVRILITENWSKFSTWPAGRSQHHTQLGGLLMHTVTVTKVSVSLANFYNELYGIPLFNIPLTKAAGLLHDIGKIEEYDVDETLGTVEFSTDAVLSTHIMNSIRMLDEFLNKHSYPNTEEVKLLRHALAAHHGKLEYGSPIKPSIPEACMLHQVDAIDADMSVFNRELSQLQIGQKNTVWNNSNMDSMRNFYKDSTKG